MAHDPLYCSITNTSGLISVAVMTNHDSSVATATFESYDTSLTLGDSVTINLGKNSDHDQIFTGYVKQIDRKTPENTYVLTAYDSMVRAQDFFIASSDPKTPFTRKGITAEDLVRDLFALAGLTDYAYTTTYFTFGINNEFEVNLVSVYDYIRTICDLLTWTIWADQTGKVYFKNRKPYVMTGTTGQPGDVADVPTGQIITPAKDTNIVYSKTEKNLRNRIVVYGTDGVHAEASASSPYLPVGFYKSAVLAMPLMIDSQGLADNIANYNLNLLNRLTEALSITVEGDSNLQARTVVEVSYPGFGISGNWYLYGVDHQLSSSGFLSNLELRRMS